MNSHRDPAFLSETPECIAEQEVAEDSEYIARKKRALSRQKRWEVVSGRTWPVSDST